MALSVSKVLPWSADVIERYQDLWRWGDGILDGLSKNPALPWSLELIDRYVDRWDWRQVSSNRGLPWSIEILEKFEKRLEWNYIVSYVDLTITVFSQSQIIEIGRASCRERVCQYV